MPGLDGKDGADGKDGERGPQGLDGKDGLPGKDGLRGEKGPQGERGEKGDTGDSGIATATYPLNIAEDGTLTIDKKFIEQLAKASKGGKIVMQGGGGNLTAVMSEGTTVNKDARHINFTGGGVNVTKGNRGQVNINIPSPDEHADHGFTAIAKNHDDVLYTQFVDNDDSIRFNANSGLSITASRISNTNLVQINFAILKKTRPTIGLAVQKVATATTDEIITEDYMNAFEDSLGKDGGQLIDGGEL